MPHTLPDGYIRFFVPGKPEPGGSKRGFARGNHVSIVDANPKAKGWKSQVAQFASDRYKGDLLDMPLDVTFVFMILRPKGHYGSGRNAGQVKASAPDYPATKPDALKLARSTEDALTGIIWRDDCLTVDISSKKRYGNRPGVWITVGPKSTSDKDYDPEAA